MEREITSWADGLASQRIKAAQEKAKTLDDFIWEEFQRPEFIGAKQVVINDYLPPGVVFATETQVILSSEGWDGLLNWYHRKRYVENAVKSIVNRKMGDVLRWLREAGHDV